MQNEAAQNHRDAPANIPRVKQLDRLQRQLTVGQSARHVVQDAAVNQSIHDIAIGRMGGVAEARRQPHHAQGEQRKQVLVLEIRGRRGQHQNSHRRQLLWVGHAGQREHVVGLLAHERQLGTRELSQHLQLAWASRNVFAEQCERADGGLERLAILQPRGVRQHELLQDLYLFERKFGPREQLLREALGFLKPPAKIHGLNATHAELVAQARIEAGFG